MPVTKHVTMVAVLLLVVLSLAPACARKDEGAGNATLRCFKHGKFPAKPGDSGNFGPLRGGNPGIRVKDESLPASSNEQHQFYVINLEGKRPTSTSSAWMSYGYRNLSVQGGCGT